MTTKQDIINHAYEFWENGCKTSDFNWLLETIEELKPKVKKREWKWNKNCSMTLCKQYYIYETDRYYKAIYIHVHDLYETDHDDIGLFDTEYQAQEACQKHYEESILQAIDYE